MPLAAIALGSNLPGPDGTRESNLDGAMRELGTMGQVRARSTWHDTAPQEYAAQPRFLNGAAVLATTLEPEALLEGLLRIEAKFGRDRSHGIEKGPRTLDLDLLLYGDWKLATPKLTVPHPLMHQRRFVLAPLAEIAPHWVHPLLGRTVAELLDGVS